VLRRAISGVISRWRSWRRSSSRERVPSFRFEF